MVVRAAPVLTRGRTAAFVAVSALVVGWYVLAPHLPHPGLWPDVVIVAFAVLPATLLPVLIAVPLWSSRLVLPATIGFALAALGCSEAGWAIGANFAKLCAAILAGWTFLWVFERLSWVVLIAAVVPVVDALSVWKGPTNNIVNHHFDVYSTIAITFLAPSPNNSVSFGPPDILFFGLFLAAAARWRLRVAWSWVGMVGMYALTIVVANAADVGGLPALPFLSAGFFAANGDLLWRELRRPGPGR